MFAILALIKDLFNLSAYPAQDRDERYLSEATDIYDLERRMRQVDADRSNAYAVGATGIFSR